MSGLPRSVLIVRLSAMGDVVHVLPSLAALRAALPDAKIGWAVEELSAPLLEGHPQLDRLHVIPRKRWIRALRRGAVHAPLSGARSALSELRSERYEVALDFQSNLRSALLARASGARRRIGQPVPFSREGSGALFTERAPAIPAAAHKIERNLNLLTPLGVAGAPARGVVPLRPPVARSGRPRVLIHPGVSLHGAIKAWRPERFAGLARHLLASGCDVLVSFGGAEERALAEALVAATPGSSLAPEAGLSGLAALLRSADLFVGVDSGPLHLAAAVGTPVLGLYGPKRISTYGPYWPGTAVLGADYPCSPCLHRHCPRPEVRHVERPDGSRAPISPCMDTISVEAVLAKATQLLREAAGSRRDS